MLPRMQYQNNNMGVAVFFFTVFCCFSALSQAALAQAGVFSRDQIRIVGSSTVFPFVAATAEQFGKSDQFRTPIVESTGTGGGFKIFCEGVGEATADIANASRPVKAAEIAQCQENGVEGIIELSIGYDGIVLANANGSPEFNLSKRDIFLALAKQVPVGGKIVANPYRSWHEVNADLPDYPIFVYGPPPTSGTRDAFVELVMHEACEELPEFKAALSGDKLKAACSAMREDGAFIEAGENDNLIVQKLIASPEALGIFGYNFLEQNAAHVKANPINGALPSVAGILDGTYQVARSLYVYVKRAHIGRAPGLHAFIRLLTSEAAIGESGFLIVKGLLPLNEDARQKMQFRAKNLEVMRRQ